MHLQYHNIYAAGRKFRRNAEVPKRNLFVAASMIDDNVTSRCGCFLLLVPYRLITY